MLKIKEIKYISYLYFFVFFFNFFSLPAAMIEMEPIVSTEGRSLTLQKRPLANLEDIEVDTEELASQDALRPHIQEEPHDLSTHFLSILSLKIYGQAPSGVNENNSIKWCRRVAKGLAITLGATAGIPFFEPSCKAFSSFITDNSVLCDTCGISMMISYGGVVTWAGLRLADRIRSENPAEKVLIEKAVSKRNEFLIHLFSNLLGAVACVPGSYGAYKYNSAKWLAIPTIAIEYILKTEGSYVLLNTLTNGIKSYQCISNKEKYDNSYFSYQVKHILASKLYPMVLDGKFSKHEIQREALDSIERLLSEDEGTYGARAGFSRAIAQFVSLVFPFGQEFMRVNLSNEGLSHFIESPYARLPLAFLISLPSFSLNTLASTRSTGAIFDIIYEKCHSKHNPTFMQYFFPNTNRFIFGLSIILTLLSSAADVYIAYDIASHSILPSLRYLLPILVVMNNVIFGSFAFTALCQTIAMASIEKFSSDNLKVGVRLTQAYEFATNTVNKFKRPLTKLR